MMLSTDASRCGTSSPPAHWSQPATARCCTGRPTIGFCRCDAADPEPQFARVLALWPAGLPRPSTVARARSQITAAAYAAQAAFDRGDDPTDPTVQLDGLAPGVPALAREIAKRRPPNVRHIWDRAITAKGLGDLALHNKLETLHDKYGPH